MSQKCLNCGIENVSNMVYCSWCQTKLSLQKPEHLDSEQVAEERASGIRQKAIGYLRTFILIIIFILTIWFVINTAGVSIRDIVPKKVETKFWSAFLQLKNKFNYQEVLALESRQNPYRINGIVYSPNGSYIMVGNQFYCLNESIGKGKIVNISQDQVTIQNKEEAGVYQVGCMIESEEKLD